MTNTTWNIDAAHSGIHFSIRHMVVSKVRGRFAKYTGTAARDEHLRAADFFDVEKFPTLQYRSTRIEQLADDRFRVIGDLTIRDVTREVVLDVEYGGRASDPWGNERAGFVAKTSIDRKDFGLRWSQVLETGGLLVGDRVDIELEVQAVKAAAVKAA